MTRTDEESKRITLERAYEASVERVWDLWTTKEGIEATWGPEGFRVDVLAHDLKPGGTLHYAMTAVAEPQVNFLKKVGFPLTSEARAIYTAVDRPKAVSYDTIVDFVPGVEPYRIRNDVSLTVSGATVTFRMTMDPLHDDEWTSRLVAGRNSQLDKLGEVLRRTGIEMPTRTD